MSNKSKRFDWDKYQDGAVTCPGLDALLDLNYRVEGFERSTLVRDLLEDLSRRVRALENWQLKGADSIDLSHCGPEATRKYLELALADLRARVTQFVEWLKSDSWYAADRLQVLAKLRELKLVDEEDPCADCDEEKPACCDGCPTADKPGASRGAR